jgi:small subunit ribosomal protein S6
MPMHTYETLFVATPTLSEEDEQATVEALAQVVSGGGGVMTVNERIGRRRLAYPIQKQADGVYIRFLYDAEPAVPKELERRIRLSDRILRVLTVRLEPNWAVAAKEQAIRDAEARAEAERERREREASGLEAPITASTSTSAFSSLRDGGPSEEDADRLDDEEGGV